MGPFKRTLLAISQKMAAYSLSEAIPTTSPKLARVANIETTVTGKAINDDTVMGITTAFACVRIIAETLGSVSLHVYERQNNGNAKIVEDHEVGGVLIDSPNLDMSGPEYMEASAVNLAARGNAYSLINLNGAGRLSSLYPMPASRVQVKKDSTTGFAVVYGFNDRGVTEWYPADKVWHWKGFGYNGLLGLSPIGCARNSLGLAMAGEEAQGRLFANGLSASAVISVPQFLKDDQRKIANDLLARMHTGLQNYGKPYLLEGGMKIEDGIFSNHDAQFLELRQFQISELCRLWRISPHMVADLERATNNNIEQLSLEFIMYTMAPYFNRIEKKARQLFTLKDRQKYFIRFNYESLLRADSAARASLYSILLQNGVFNRNEVRALENRNRVDDPAMDGYTVQSNMAPIDALADLVARNLAQRNPGGNKP